MSTRATLRADLRLDLRDVDAGAYRWTDAELNRHLQRAVEMYQESVPLDVAKTIAAVAGQRTYALAGGDAIPGLIAVERVEYPAGRYPRQFVHWELRGADLTLSIDGEPADGEDILVHATCAHVVNDAGSTVPAEHEHVVLTGAAGLAALAWANFAVNRVVTSSRTPEHYAAWAERRLAAFRAVLSALHIQRTQRAASTIAISGYEV